jgi:hypothetical protein
MKPYPLDHISHGMYRFLFFVGQFNRKFIFNAHHKLKAVKARYAKIMDQMRTGSYLRIAKQKRLSQHRSHSLFYCHRIPGILQNRRVGITAYRPAAPYTNPALFRGSRQFRTGRTG